MLEAISYNNLLNDLQENVETEKAIGILIGNPNCEFVKNNIINKVSQYHHRSGNTIDFYFPGYGAYWFESIPDGETICKINGVDWSFSPEKFNDFLIELESKSKWQYSGETELLILNYKNGALDFSEVLVFWLDRMVKEGVIYSPSNFFESIFRMFKQNHTIERTSDKLSFKQMGTHISKIINEKAFGAIDLFNHTAYFCTKDLRK